MAESTLFAIEVPVPAALVKRKKFKGKKLSVKWYASNDVEVTTYLAQNATELMAVLPNKEEIEQAKTKEEQEAMREMSNPKNWQLVDIKTLSKLPFMNEVKNYTQMAQYGRGIMQQLAHGEVPLTNVKGLAFVTAKHFLQQYIIEPMKVLKVALNVAKGDSKDLTEAQTKILSENDDMKERLREEMRKGKDYSEAVAFVMKEKEKELEHSHMRA